MPPRVFVRLHPCGGLTCLVIRYGHFYTCIHPLPQGHVNVGFELDVDLDQALAAVQEVVAVWTAENPR